MAGATAVSRAAAPQAPPRSGLACATRPSRGRISGLGNRALCGGLPKAPLAAGEDGKTLLEVSQAEVGPQPRTEMQLRVGQIPKQKIAEALLATGADEEIGLGQPRQCNLPGEQIFGEVLRTRGTAGALQRQLACRLDDVPAAAI